MASSRKVKLRKKEYDIEEVDSILEAASDLPDYDYQLPYRDTIGLVHEPRRKIFVQKRNKDGTKNHSRMKKNEIAFHEMCHIALGHKEHSKEYEDIVLALERELFPALYRRGLRII